MALFAEHREVRVTERKSVKTPFVAPDQAPVSTHHRELEKGRPGWTDMDTKVVEVSPAGNHLRVDHLDAVVLAGITAREPHEVIRKAPSKAEVRRPRPTKRRWA